MRKAGESVGAAIMLARERLAGAAFAASRGANAVLRSVSARSVFIIVKRVHSLARRAFLGFERRVAPPHRPANVTRRHQHHWKPATLRPDRGGLSTGSSPGRPGAPQGQPIVVGGTDG